MSVQIIEKNQIVTIRVTNSGKGFYQSFYTDGKRLFHVITGGNSCTAGEKRHIENFNLQYHNIKELYDCKKHNAIAKKITGTTINSISNGLSELIKQISGVVIA